MLFNPSKPRYPLLKNEEGYSWEAEEVRSCTGGIVGQL